jgi:excisionase family DNA binding protein
VYLTIKETAVYLELPEKFIEQLIDQQRIRVVYDGEQYLINKEQFKHHLEQMNKWKQRMEEESQEPIPEDYDVKDED